jgi:two-component system, cell cycle response regulator DivK
VPDSLKGGGGVRVLLVEDNGDLRHLYARSLRRHGCIVLDVADALAALEAVVEFSPDLVLTDVMMPAIDGIELIRRLRARPELAAIPIVAMTASVTTEHERRARSAGAVDFIVKPADIRRILGRFRRDRGATEGGL